MTTTFQAYAASAHAAKLCSMTMVKSVVGRVGLIRRDWRVVLVGVDATKHGRSNPGSGVY